MKRGNIKRKETEFYFTINRNYTDWRDQEEVVDLTFVDNKWRTSDERDKLWVSINSGLGVVS